MSAGGTGEGATAGPPLLTLLTDFGSADPFVGMVKARILALCPETRIVDLTHAIPAFAVEVAAFWIERTHVHFPPGTVHVCVVDPGVGTSRRILALEHGRHVFLAPDNGLLAGLAGREGATVRRLDPAFLAWAGLAGASPTFHGRDIFAPVAALLAGGRASFAELGEVVEDWRRESWKRPSVTAGGIEGRVIWVDNFGNSFSNIDATLVADCEACEVIVGGRRLPVVETYGERPAGSLVALVNASGVLEAACVEGRADELLGIGPGARFEVRYRRG